MWIRHCFCLRGLKSRYYWFSWLIIYHTFLLTIVFYALFVRIIAIFLHPSSNILHLNSGNILNWWPYVFAVLGIFTVVTMWAVLVTEGCRKIKLQYYGFKLASSTRWCPLLSSCFTWGQSLEIFFRTKWLVKLRVVKSKDHLKLVLFLDLCRSYIS